MTEQAAESAGANPSNAILKLPPELREQIYELVVAKPPNTLTILSNHDCHESEISAAQPALSRACRQLRLEILSMFYSSNVYLARVSAYEDLLTAKRWLAAIGDTNVGSLRRLAVCGEITIIFVCTLSRSWVKTVLDLKEGTISMVEGTPRETGPRGTPRETNPRGTAGLFARRRRVAKVFLGLKGAYREMVDARAGRRFDVESVGRLLDGLHEVFTAY